MEKNDTVGELFATSRSTGDAIGKMVNWKTMILTVTVCSLVGMAICGGGFLLAGEAATSFISGAIGVTTISGALGIGACVGATFGVSFGIAYPPIFSGMTKGVADLLSNKFVRGESAFSPVKTATQMEQEATKNRAISQTPTAYALAANNNEPITRVSHSQNSGRLEAPLQQGINV
ncbi:MAG: hypothetical protein K2X09_02645 [Rickettsiales bacterium]|nr:hypothetical protein [Rickettsiales bacterium]